MQITVKQLTTLTDLTEHTVQLYMANWQLTKYLKSSYVTYPSGRYRVKTVDLNSDFIQAFSDFMKIKHQDSKGFKWKANQLLRKAGK